jgi:hypothetical protein
MSTKPIAGPLVDVQGVLTDALRTVALFVPKLLAFAAILAIGWLVGRLLLRTVDRALHRIGLDRAIERAGLQPALTSANLTASQIAAKIVYYATLLLSLQIAFSVWGPNPVSTLITGIIAWLPKAVVALVIVVVAMAIARAVRTIVSTALGGLSYGRLLARICSYAIIGLGVIAALNQIGVATTVTTPVLIAVLATVGGICVVGLGGGLIRPMQARWERWLSRAEHESHAIGQHARAYSAGWSDTENAPIFAGASATVGLTDDAAAGPADKKTKTKKAQDATPVPTGTPLTPSR